MSTDPQLRRANAEYDRRMRLHNRSTVAMLAQRDVLLPARPTAAAASAGGDDLDSSGP